MNFLQESNYELSEELKESRPDFKYSVRKTKNIFTKQDDSHPRLKEEYKNCLLKLANLELSLKKRLSSDQVSLSAPSKGSNIFQSKQIKSQEVKGIGSEDKTDFSNLQE